MTLWLHPMLKTSLRLGLSSVARAAAYRIGCRTGLYRRLLPQRHWRPAGDFFTATPLSLPDAGRAAIVDRSERLLAGELTYFSSTPMEVGAPPDWFLDPFTGKHLSSGQHWSDCDEFADCDIKRIWEASRFEWVPVLASAWQITRDAKYLRALNAWLLDWVEKNPPNTGPNWKCGQETSIRVINLLLGARLLAIHDQPLHNLVQLVALHCSRILPTIGYAIAQNNNHGISEAAALFVGGGWLMKVADAARLRKKGQHWHRQGRLWLEDRIATLVARDGSFSQYSVNYHRLLLDTLSQVEIWRRKFKEPSFSVLYSDRCSAATQWLSAVTDPETGLAPNLGANDGARLYDLSLAPYRDLRPSVQLASTLFRGGRAYQSREWDETLRWQGVDPDLDTLLQAETSRKFPDGGYVLLRCGESLGLVRYANFRFRPSHADCLHLDLWHRGVNILRDGGTFSYNTEPRLLGYFSGTQSHNTVQFDDRSQMPRVGRFLFGEWLAMERCTEIVAEGDLLVWSGTYRDWMKARHSRTVSVQGRNWRITDEIDGCQEKAVLRWRLIPADWRLDQGTCDSRYAQLRVVTSAPVRRLELVTGWESQHYQEMTELPVLEIEVGPGHWTINTEITLKD